MSAWSVPFQNLQQSVHPIVLYTIQKLVIILLLAFTPPNSLLRFAPFPILLSISFFILPYYNLHFTRYADMMWAAGEILMGHLEYLEKLLLSQWNFQDQAPSAEGKRHESSRNKLNSEVIKDSSVRSTANKSSLNQRNTTKSTNSSSSSLDDIYSRLKFGLWGGTSHRYIATPSQTQHTPSYSSSSPSYIPSRTAFLLRKALIIFSCILILDLIALSELKPKNPILITEENSKLIPRASELSVRWAVTRMRATAAHWLESYAGIQMYYSALTSFGVALGMTSPAERRPVFGSVADAYTLRGYWG